MKFLHSMVRVKDINKSLHFYCEILGLEQVRKLDFEEAKFSLYYLRGEDSEAEVELTHNWEGEEEYSNGRNFGHLAFEVTDIYQTCKKIQDSGVEILRPPRDGFMAFIKSPDGISIELLQKGDALAPQAPWDSMENSGSW